MLHRRTPLAVLVAVTVAVCAAAGCTGPDVREQPVSAADGNVSAATGPVAVVDGVALDEAALDRRVATITSDSDVRAALTSQPGLEAQLRADVTGQMVEAQLIAAAAPGLGVTTTDEDLQAYVDEIVTGYLGGTENAWQTFLDERGYPEDEVLAQLREDLRREQLEDVIAPDVVVSDEEVAAAYTASYAGRPQVAHILVAERASADAVMDQLRAGADFAETARTTSLDSGTAAQGGDLGPWAKGDLTASVDEALERGRDGTLIGPVASPFGWHVVRRDPPASLEAVAPVVRERLADARQNEAVNAWVATLRPDADVVVRADVGRWDPGTGRISPVVEGES